MISISTFPFLLKQALRTTHKMNRRQLSVRSARSQLAEGQDTTLTKQLQSSLTPVSEDPIGRHMVPIRICRSNMHIHKIRRKSLKKKKKKDWVQSTFSQIVPPKYHRYPDISGPPCQMYTHSTEKWSHFKKNKRLSYLCVYTSRIDM